MQATKSPGKKIMDLNKLGAILSTARKILDTACLEVVLAAVINGVIRNSGFDRAYLALFSAEGEMLFEMGRDHAGSFLPPESFHAVLPEILDRLVYMDKNTATPLNSGSRMLVPLYRPDREDGAKGPAGFLYAENSSGQSDALTEENRRFASIMALHAGIALEMAALREDASIDGLTRLYQRRFFDVASEKEWQRSSRHQRPVSILMMDLDGFKTMNDTYGHDAGDLILRRVSNLLKECSRKEDLVARYGGDELVVLLPETDETGCTSVAFRIQDHMKNLPLPPELRTITASIGIATSPFNKAESIQQLLKYADLAMYEAKRQGGNKWILFGTETKNQ